MPRPLALLSLSLIALPLTAHAEDAHVGWLRAGLLKPASYAKPFVAETHSYMTKVQLGYSQVLNEFNIAPPTDEDAGERSFKLLIDAHLGVDLPLFSHDFSTTSSLAGWSFAASLPLSIHVLEDMFEALTAPVISTDYRFGAPLLRAIRRFDDGGFVKNIAIAWLPIYHECTHLGDEITIYRKDVELPITRINVSYEYTQLELTLNDPDGTRANNHSFRLGTLMRLSSRDLGWYGVELEGTESENIDLPQSHTLFEFWGIYQWQRSSGLLADDCCMNVVSVEIRNRPQYGVPTFKGSAGNWEVTRSDELRRTGVSAYWGYRFFAHDTQRESLGLYLHAYLGVNPYGQLRNMYPYRFFGLSLTHEPW
jgi:hypothetical protein